LATTLQPLLAACFQRLADGTSLGLRGERLRVHDAFIVRYDADTDMSVSLPEHSDTSLVSFTLSLNSAGTSFRGGGTWFRALQSEEAPHHDGFHASGVVDADAGDAAP